ncbi:MAG: LamG domain-containing protein, partial [Pirellulaceae bacterium]|nr:LamG domain-containing protein [Pirellulaceae bacterium]
MPVTGPDLVLWLDAQELAGRGDAAGNPAAGAAIETWADKSGYHHDVRQAAAEQRPSYVRDVLDSGRHVVHFRAAGKQFLSAGNPATAFVVARAGSSGSDMWLFSKNAWGPPWTGYGIAISNDGLHPWPHFGLETGAHGYFKFGGNVKSGFRVVEVCYDGAVAQGVLDDRPDSQQVVSGEIAGNGQDLLIGTLGSQFLEGDIAEVLIYRRALSEQERQQTRRYLLDKYGLPMGYAQPGDSPLVSDWLFQAEGHPLLDRIHQEIRWTRELAARLARNPRTPDLSRDLAELDALAATPAAVPGQRLGRAAARERYLAVRQLKRRIMLKNPLLDFQQLLCIDQPYPEGSEWKHQAIHRLGHRAVPGGRLLILEGFDPSSPARQLGPEKPGSYWRPDVSFDGQR